uniref:Protein PAIR1-like n=1 Tax=Rhizophora mucronata TaxID=61149 RepID=A0A2P2INY0_RHIMU
MQQKLIALDSSPQLMNKGQEDIKLNIDGSLKSLPEQLNKDAYQDKLQQIFFALLPYQSKWKCLT